MKLDGLGVFVKDMPTMVRFYRDILGFEIKEAEDASNVFLKKDGTLFLFYRRSGFEKMTGHVQIALGVENFAAVDKAYNEIVAKGGESVMPPTTEPWGTANLLHCRPRRESCRNRFFHERIRCIFIKSILLKK